MNFNVDLSSNAHLLSLGVGIFPTSARGSAYLADPCDGMRRDDEGRGGSCFTMVPACCAISLVVILHTGVELTATRPTWTGPLVRQGPKQYLSLPLTPQVAAAMMYRRGGLEVEIEVNRARRLEVWYSAREIRSQKLTRMLKGVLQLGATSTLLMKSSSAHSSIKVLNLNWQSGLYRAFTWREV